MFAGTSEEALEMNGEVSQEFLTPPGLMMEQYLTAWARRQTPSKFASDEHLMKKLWDWCEEQVKDY